jgi:hypothetical protein
MTPDLANLPGLLNTQTVCELLWGDAKPSTRIRLYNMIKDNHVEAIKMDRKYWVPKTEVKRMLKI